MRVAYIVRRSFLLSFNPNKGQLEIIIVDVLKEFIE